MSLPPPCLVALASKSAIRAQLLRQAGVAFAVVDSHADEEALKAQLSGSPAQLAEGLAVAKAKGAIGLAADTLVIGADQTLEFEGQLFDKAKTPEDALARLRAFRGQWHALHSGFALVRDGAVVHSQVVSARLKVREVTETWLQTYGSKAGAALTQCVGGYEFEGLGAQLFEQVDGDFHTILGLPLLPLLSVLREHGGLAS